MTNRSEIHYGRRMVCTQAGCLLRRPGLKARHLADLLARILAGQSLDDIVPESELISARPQCSQCALRVLQGKKAFRTEDEWRYLDELGHWHHRRQRRNRRLAYL